MTFARVAIVVVLLGVLGFALGVGPAPEDGPTGPSPATEEVARSTDEAASVASPADERAGEPLASPATIDFDRVPSSHRPGVVRPKVPLVGEALREQFPHAGVVMLDAECTSAPCILGFDYDAAAVVSGAGGVRAFRAAVRATFEAQLGYPVTSMHVDDLDGGHQVWMFAVPPEIDTSDPLRNQLIETGHHRHAVLIDAVPRRPSQAP